MRTLETLYVESLVWRPPVESRDRYELVAGGVPVATMDAPRRGPACANGPNGRWMFSRPGFFRRQVVVRTVGGDEPVATFDRIWTGGGTVATATGARFRWRATNFRRSCWVWRGMDGNEPVRFARGRGRTADVTLAQDAAAVPEVPLLINLGWYLLLVHANAEPDSTYAALFGAAGS